MTAIGDDAACVVQYQLPGAELACTADAVVDVEQHCIGAATEQSIVVAVGEHQLPAATQAGSAEQDLQAGAAVVATKGNHPFVDETATKRHDGPVIYGEGTAVAGHRIDVELEVRLAEQRPIDLLDRDALALANADHRIAIGVIAYLHVCHAGDAGKADQIQPVGGHVEVVDDVVADGLGEHELIRTG
ncbi:hypothetical protein D3C80_812710 [compost metagenome]